MSEKGMVNEPIVKKSMMHRVELISKNTSRWRPKELYTMRQETVLFLELKGESLEDGCPGGNSNEFY